jgi:hypothetical protein
MPATLTIRDESTSGETLHEFPLEVLNERITVQELIRSRVYQEVKDFNARRPKQFKGLIQPTDAEQTLNGCRPDRKRPLNWKAQYERALTAFRTGQVLILVDERQVESLEEEIVVTPTTQVSFLRLTLLVGG